MESTRLSELVNWDELRELGILKQINERVAMPNGLQLTYEDDGTSKGAVRIANHNLSSSWDVQALKAHFMRNKVVGTDMYYLTEAELDSLIALAKGGY